MKILLVFAVCLVVGCVCARFCKFPQRIMSSLRRPPEDGPTKKVDAPPTPSDAQELQKLVSSFRDSVDDFIAFDAALHEYESLDLAELEEEIKAAGTHSFPSERLSTLMEQVRERIGADRPRQAVRGDVTGRIGKTS